MNKKHRKAKVLRCWGLPGMDDDPVLALQQAMRRTEMDLDIPHLNSREALEIIRRLPTGWKLVKGEKPEVT